MITSKFDNHETIFILNFLESLGNIFKVSSFVARKDTQVNLEKSSITRKAYLFSPGMHVLVGPDRSILDRSKASRGQDMIFWI